MSLALIRDRIETTLSGVTGIGTVHDYLRWSNNWKNFLSQFKTSGDLINGWMITRVSTKEEHETASHATKTHTFKIIGVYGLKDEDETEITFQALIESISAAFRADYGLNGQAVDTSPIQVEIVEPRIFGNVLCHYCELSITASEILAWS